MVNSISVIIPTLNEEKVLPKLLGDLSKQTVKNFEVIVVDAHSEDRTVEIAKKFKDKLKLKTIISDRRNLSYQRNLGAKHAKGDFLTFIDADCRVSKGFIKNIFQEIKYHKPLVIFPSFSTSTKELIDKALFSFTNIGLQTAIKLKMPFASGSCLIFERHFFEFIGGFKVVDEQDKGIFFPEDMEIIKRVLSSGVTPYFSKKIRFRYSMRRFKKEGYLKILFDYFLVSLNVVLGIDKLNIRYKMGGDYYKDMDKRERKEIIRKLNLALKKVKKFLKQGF